VDVVDGRLKWDHFREPIFFQYYWTSQCILACEICISHSAPWSGYKNGSRCTHHLLFSLSQASVANYFQMKVANAFPKNR